MESQKIKHILIFIVIGSVLIFFLIISKKRAEESASLVIEKCWNAEVTLSTKINLKQGFNWRIASEDSKYGDVPEILVNIFSGKIIWRHFEEIGEPKVGCGNY